MIIKDIMSKDIACVNSEDSIEKAAKLMKERDVGSIPVCSEGRVVGIITDRDIAVRWAASGQKDHSYSIRDIMSGHPTVGNPDMNVRDAAKIMGQKQIRRLPIVENDRLVGVVSLGDISLEPSTQDNAEAALKNISHKEQ